MIVVSVLVLNGGATRAQSVAPQNDRLRGLEYLVVESALFYIRTYEGQELARTFFNIINEGKILKKSKQIKELKYQSENWLSSKNFDNTWLRRYERKALGDDSRAISGWYMDLWQLRFENLATIDMNSYQFDLSEEHFNNYVNLTNAIRQILVSGLDNTDADKRNEEIRLKLAVMGLSLQGRKLPLHITLGAQFQLRMDEAQKNEINKNGGKKLSTIQNINILNKLLKPIYLYSHNVDHIFPAGAVNTILIGEDYIYMKKEDIPSSLYTDAKEVLRRVDERLGKSIARQIASNMYVFGNRNGARQWLWKNKVDWVKLPVFPKR